MFINRVGLGVLVACQTIEFGMTKRRLERPRIKTSYVWGGWQCSDGQYVGGGYTPKEAYESWLASREEAATVEAEQPHAARIPEAWWKFWKQEG